jgi:Pol polyprotein, beta-barrel domain
MRCFWWWWWSERKRVMKADCHSKAKKKEKEDDKKGGRLVNTATEGEEFAFTTMFAGMALALGTSLLTGHEVDVYDSGALGHMLPNCHRFTTFREIAPHAINATDKTIFKVTGIGNMRIGIPNGKTTTHVTLKDVLYCPDLAFTLVSLMRCDAAGYSVLLKDRKCWIQDMKGTLLRQVPLSNGLYKLEHKTTVAVANAVCTPLMLDELHRHMGHISPQAALSRTAWSWGLMWTYQPHQAFARHVHKQSLPANWSHRKGKGRELRSLVKKSIRTYGGPQTPKL